jgi:hypothetical protein
MGGLMNDFTKDELLLIKYGIDCAFEEASFFRKIKIIDFAYKIQSIINNYEKVKTKDDSTTNLIGQIAETDFQYAMAKSIAGQVMNSEQCKQNPYRVFFLAGLMINELITEG